jgi:hypothetical protein
MIKVWKCCGVLILAVVALVIGVLTPNSAAQVITTEYSSCENGIPCPEIDTGLDSFDLSFVGACEMAANQSYSACYPFSFFLDCYSELGASYQCNGTYVRLFESRSCYATKSTCFAHGPHID